MNKKILPVVALLIVLAIPSLPLTQTRSGAASTTKAQPLILGYLDPEAFSGRIADFVERGTPAPSSTTSSVAFTWDVNQEVSVEHFAPNIIISQTEPTIAVSPANSNILVAGYHDLFPTPDDFACSFSFSHDGGATWTFGDAVKLVKPSDFCSDPALAADGAGNFYYAYLSVRASASTTDVVVARSRDGGQTFPDIKIAATGVPRVSFPDKEYIAVTSTGQIFVTYTDFHNGGNGQITLVRASSFDAGFGPPLRISDQAVFPRAISGSDPFIAPDGTLYIAYADFTAGTGPLAIRIARVAGSSVTTFTVASSLPSTGRFRLNNGDPNFGIIPGTGFRSNSFPTASAGPEGNLYVAWVQFPSLSSCTPDGTGRPSCVNADVFFSSSPAGPSVGTVWTTPTRVNDDVTTTDQFFPWLTVQPNGVITIIFGDKRLDPSNVVYNVFSASSGNAGATFSANVKVTDAASDPAGSTFIGDYFNAASSSIRVNAIWTDRRFGNEDIFASRTL